MERLPGARSRPGWHTETLSGAPLSIAGQRLAPIERVTEVGWRGVALAWHRPAFIEVRQEDTVYRLPIHDQTRRLMAAIVAAELALGAVGFGMWRGLSRRKRAAR